MNAAKNSGGDIQERSAPFAISSRWYVRLAFAVLFIFLVFVAWGLWHYTKMLLASEVAIDTTISTTVLRHQKSGNNVVCTSTDNCYVFYINSDQDVEYQKSTDGGTTWPGTSTEIHSGTWVGLAVWYDQWTPGNSGTLVHLAYFSTSDDLVYSVFDTSGDSIVSTNTIIAVTGAQGTLTNNNDVAITRGTDGDLYIGTVDAQAASAPASFVHKCASSCATDSSWVSAGSNPWTQTGDALRNEHDLVLLPLSDTAAHDTGDIMLVSLDIADDTVEYSVYDDSADSWSSDFTDIGSATDNATYRHTLSGTVDPTTGDLYVSAVHNAGTADTSEIRAWTYSDGWTQLTDPWPDTTDSTSIILDSSIGVDGETGNLYITYLRADSSATANDAYYAVSTDSGSSWSAGNLISDGTDRDHRNSTMTSSGDRLFGMWMTGGALYGNTVFIPTITVSATGTQTTLLDINVSDQYVGGSFVFNHVAGSTTVETITITETGTVHAANSVDNVRLYYEMDTSAPYDCASESYAGTEAQFGSTVSAGFSSADGTAAFSDAVQVTATSALCAYVVVDLTGGGTAGETLEVEINDASSDVTITNGEVLPASTVSLSGTSTLQGGVLSQTHYHWRNDDGTESTATSATDGLEDTPVSNVLKNQALRLRVGISNKSTSTTTQYRLEYGLRSTTCSAISLWADVGNPGGAWDMSDSSNLTDGAHTTNIATSTGGVSDENTTFQGTNGAVKDTSSQTSNITLSNTQHTDLEFSIEARDEASFGSTYCFRLTHAGMELPGYAVYAQATIRDNSDFYVQRGSTTVSGTTATITAGVDYAAPADISHAFIRITNTQATGAGRDAGGGTQNADDVMVYISNPANIQNSITFTRFGAADNTRVAWEIVEYIGPDGGDNEILVRSASTVTFGTTALVASSTVSGVVDDADVVVFVTGAGNPDTGTGDYNTANVTTNWVGSSNEAVFERGEDGGDDSVISFAAVEFVGANWIIQRAEHTYTNGGLPETQSITPVNDLSRAFLHVQKRTGTNLSGLDEHGHEVYLSAVGELTFQIEGSGGQPANQTSVAWVMENTQTTGIPMNVTRSSGPMSTSEAGTDEPAIVNIDIGTTLSTLSNASIFTNNRVTGTGAAFPRSMIAVELVSTTQYQFWMSDIGNIRTYRTEVVEWPTAVRTLTQSYYRFYVDNDAIDPTDAWPQGGTDLGENTSITSVDAPPTQGDVIRMRMSVHVAGSNLSASTTAFKLQYGVRSTSCSAISEWLDVGDTASTTAAWRGYDATPADGTALSGNPPTAGDLNLSVSDRAGTYEEENITPGNPYKIFIGEDIEYDWVVEDNTAADQTTYCFRMVEYDNTELGGYDFYPTILTAGYELRSQNWQWYDDEVSETPLTSLAAEDVAPIDVQNDNTLKLRITAQEIAGKDGANVKLKLQFSEYSDFSQEVYDLVEIGDCEINSLWCYDDGGGVDNAVISTGVLTDSDSCAAGSGSGCGTHNESAQSVSSFTQDAYSSAEFEFTLKHAGARVNTVYFFRLYDVTNDVPVVTGNTYPSLATEGAALTFNIAGISQGTAVEGITTDINTSSTGISFGSLPISASVTAAQRLTVSTNATNGYKVFAFQRQGLVGDNGDEIDPVTGTNATPANWTTACDVSADGCYGYHSGEDVLDGGSTRFAADDTYAQFSETPEEIAYSIGPTSNEATDFVYRVEVRGLQEAGLYESTIVFIITPVF